MTSRIRGQGMLLPGDSVVSAKECSGDGCAVLLSDGGPNQWIVTIEARIGDQFATVGRVLTTPPGSNVEPRSRVVAVANMPGAVGWRASFRGSKDQTAWAMLIGGAGVGAGVPGVFASRPRPRIQSAAGGVGAVLTTFDAYLLSIYASDSSDPAAPIPAAGAWVQFFNQTTAPVAGQVPIYEHVIATLGSFVSSFDVGIESGDPRFTKGIAWGLSSTPRVYTPIAALGTQVNLVAVLG